VNRASSWIVATEEAGARLDKFLADPARLGSRRQAAAAIARGKIFVNDREVTADDGGTRLGCGDRVRVWQDRPGSSRARRSRTVAATSIRVLYEDPFLLVVDKPPGLLTVPRPGQDDESVEGALVRHLRSRGKRRPLVVHRIDRDTSGLVVFATRPDVQLRLKDQFRRHESERVYLAVVYGHPSPPSGTWRDRLVWDEHELIQKETHARDPRGTAAECRYRVLERFAETSLIEVTLVTGKRNQIRLQARLRGHTLVGERRYVYGPDVLRPVDFPRQALHAHRLGFRHPGTAKLLRFESPLPTDIKELIDQLSTASFLSRQESN